MKLLDLYENSTFPLLRQEMFIEWEVNIRNKFKAQSACRQGMPKGSKARNDTTFFFFFLKIVFWVLKTDISCRFSNSYGNMSEGFSFTCMWKIYSNAHKMLDIKKKRANKHQWKGERSDSLTIGMCRFSYDPGDFLNIRITCLLPKVITDNLQELRVLQ